jgi:hypothetical protein
MTPKRILLILFALSLLLTTPALLAAEEAAAETPSSPVGISTLIFLLGLGAVIIVGGAMLARDSFKSENED